MQFPDRWIHVKVDLFDNATEEEQKVFEHSFKLSLSVIMRDVKQPKQYRASMSSHKGNRFVKRGVEEIYDTDPHYRLVQAVRERLSGQNIRHWCSKFYPSGGKNEGFIPGLTGFVFEQGHEFKVAIILETEIYEIDLTGQLTSAQRQGNLVGTYSWGATSQSMPARTRAANELL